MEEKLNDQEIIRREKLKKLEELGVNPWGERFDRTDTTKSAREKSNGKTNEELDAEHVYVKLAGRIMSLRKMGKASFLNIQDKFGKIQGYISIDTVGQNEYEIFKICDIGDIVGLYGRLMLTRTGELTIRVEEFTFLTKSLRVLPEKFHGLEDAEMIYRERYVDLIMNEDEKKKFLFRSAFIKELRNYLNDKGYVEIETPILNNKPSGATAKPFITHHNALDIDLYLRIAPETYLKRAIVGGFTKVFEIARCFRNEGMDTTHLQDFTMIEGYGAYLNYKDNMVFLRELLQSIILKLFGTLSIQVGDKMVDLSGEWPSVSFRDLILKYAAIDIYEEDTKEKLLAKIREMHIEIESEVPLENLGYGNLVDQLYKKVARPHLVNPIFLVEHPISLSPLARANDENPNLTDRFQLVINGAEIINAYSELVDPQEQERRLEEQARLKAHGDEEAMPMDYDYISAMEYGMPPISGWGMGIDRLLQLLTNSDNIKDVVMFPLMRPKDQE